jgi:hypothetical protein
MWEMLLSHMFSHLPTWRLPMYMALPAQVMWRIYDYHCNYFATIVDPTFG